MSSVLRVDRRGPVMVLTLQRPDVLNALSYDVIRALHATLDGLGGDRSCRVVVVTGAGRGFCAGIDLSEQADGAVWDDRVGELQSAYALQEAVAGLVLKLRRLDQPVIAAVNGVAAGGGLALACAADVRIAEPAARFNAAFVKIGASGGDLGSSWFLPRIVGWDRAAELLYTGRMVEAAEAERIGLVSRVVGEGAALGAALDLADEMLAVAPFSTRMTKSLLRLSMDGASLEQMLELENRTQILMTRTGDFAEGVRAFAERRAPSYEDR